MTNLSPAAQEILAAYENSPFEYDTGHLTACAAVLRAAADQVVPANGSRKNNEIRAQLLAIAAELEAMP
jgi:hypothetical protein